MPTLEWGKMSISKHTNEDMSQRWDKLHLGICRTGQGRQNESYPSSVNTSKRMRSPFVLMLPHSMFQRMKNLLSIMHKRSIRSVPIALFVASLKCGRSFKAGTYLEWGNIEVIRGCLCSCRRGSTPTRANCLMCCVDWSISCWYIKGRQQARLVSICAQCVVNMHGPY